jgi:hypothetical protein
MFVWGAIRKQLKWRLVSLDRMVDKRASVPATTESQHGGADADNDSAHRRHQRLAAANERKQEAQWGAIEVARALRRIAKICQAVPGGEHPGHTCDQHATDCVTGVSLSSAAVIASYMARVSTFFLSGLFIRMVRMPPASVTITWSVIRPGGGWNSVRRDRRYHEGIV